MKILHVVRQFEPAIGGLESYVKNMCLFQQAQGHSCEVLTLNRVFHSEHKELPADETINGIQVHRVPFIGHRRFFVPFVPLSYFRQFDIIHVHNTDFFFDYIALISVFLRQPLFATTHGGFFHTKDFSLIKKLYFNIITRFSCKRYQTLFAISQNDYDTFEKEAKHIVLQHNAIAPLGNFIASGEDFIYIGRLAKHKQVDLLIKTFAVLKHQHNIAGNLHIVGPGWDVSVEELAKVAEAENVRESVKLHGFIAEEEVQAILPQCGYFASASSFEGFGMSLLEAMSVGLIPFAQPNPAFVELIQLGGIGACVDYTQPQEAAAQIAQGMVDIVPAQRQAAQDFAATFSWDELAKRSIKAYEDAHVA
jgi:alpha-1,3-mannosyltransferase